jgi:hypothetical protein
MIRKIILANSIIAASLAAGLLAGIQFDWSARFLKAASRIGNS